MRRSTVCPIHVGRDRELAVLADRIDGLSAHGGSFVTITGAAGMGKSRLVAELRGLAAARDLVWLSGQCRATGAEPYAPFTMAVRRATRALPDDAVVDLFGGPAQIAAALLPERAQLLPLPASQPPASALFAATWQLLRRLAGTRGAVLVIEDLHWADPDSVRLLAALVPELADLPLLVVGTYRSGELATVPSLRETLSDLTRDGLVTEVELGPLDQPQIAAMLSAICEGAEVGQAVSRAILDRTDGNPFFVEEVTKVLLEQGALSRETGEWQQQDVRDVRLPATVRETLLARVAGLNDESLRVLRVAALAGERLDPEVLAMATASTPTAIDEVIQRGIELQLVTDSHEGGTAYSFRHALIREAIAGELVGPERSRAHRALADAKLACRGGGDGLGRIAGEIADHLVEAGDLERAGELAVLAARAAVTAVAAQEGEQRWEQALALVVADDARRLALLLEAAGPLASPGTVGSGWRFAHRAQELARSLPDPVAEARALVTIANESWNSGDTHGSIDTLRTSLELVEGRDLHLEAWVSARLARLLVFVDDSDAASALIERGLDAAERSGNTAALSWLWGTRVLTAATVPALLAAVDASERAAREAGDVGLELSLMVNTGYVCLWRGVFDLAERALRRALTLVDVASSPDDRYPAVGLAWLLALLGRYDESRALAEPVRGDRSVPTRVVALTALCEVAEHVAPAELPDLVAELLAASAVIGEQQRSVPALAAQARLVLAQSGVVAAAPHFELVLRATTSATTRGSHWAFSPDFAQALARDGRQADLERWVSGVRPLTLADPTPHNAAAGTLCDAYLAVVGGDAREACALFADAARRYDALPCPTRRVEALIGLAGAQWQLDGSDASAAAARDALAAAGRIGSGPLLLKAQEAVERSAMTPVLVTVLFTDIVGSTAMAVELGDRAWNEVLQRHHALVRRELARAHGREIDTAGDGFLAAFDSPAAAIRCAWAIREALAAAGLQVRAGLHTGECLQVGAKLTGVAVHIAARINALAGADDVLVSGTVRDLLAGSHIGFEQRGEHELKGVPGSWRVFAADRG